MYLFLVKYHVDNGMERFNWKGYVIAKSSSDAIKFIEEKIFDKDDLFRLISINGMDIEPGMIFRDLLTKRKEDE